MFNKYGVTPSVAPNEYMVIEPGAGSRVAGLAQIEKYYVDFLFAFSEMNSK